MFRGQHFFYRKGQIHDGLRYIRSVDTIPTSTVDGKRISTTLDL